MPFWEPAGVEKHLYSVRTERRGRVKADNAEFERIVTEYAPVMYRAALAVTGSEAAAEDAVGDAVLRAWQRLGSLREPSSARAWLVKIAVNCARGQLRRGHETSLEGMGEEIPAPEPGRERELRDAVARLSAERRAVVTLYYYEGFSTAEIAAMLGIRRGTVKSRLARAREDLKTILEG